MRANVQETNAMPEDNTPANTPEAPAEAVKAPPWGEDANFDAARAWTLLQNKDADLAKLKDKIATHDKAAQERADAEKSELQKAVERAERAEKSMADRDAAERRKAVLDKHGLTEDDAAFLTGVADDDLDAKAQALATRLGVSKTDPAEELPGKPKPRLVPGHATADDDTGDFDPNALADNIRKGY